ncbi:hypothetical protein EBR96_01400 [bacterium]|nr:hypothetical protein [bacterium]
MKIFAVLLLCMFAALPIHAQEVAPAPAIAPSQDVFPTPSIILSQEVPSPPSVAPAQEVASTPTIPPSVSEQVSSPAQVPSHSLTPTGSDQAILPSVNTTSEQSSTVSPARALDESLLFSSPETVQVISSNPTLNATLDRESVSFSGQLLSDNLVLFSRDSGIQHSAITSYALGNLFIDARLQKGVKAFINTEIYQVPATATSGASTVLSIREMFLDFNLNRQVYVRAGKQVVQWGRAYFWNPTDLINVEKRDFFLLNRFREGNYGTRVQVPIGNEQNVTVFLSNQNALQISQLSLAAQYEFVVQNTEIGLSTWQKYGGIGVFGGSISTRVFGLDVKGETAFSYGENGNRMTVEDGVPRLTLLRDQWINKSVISVTKPLDWEYAERINVIGELFYNGAGYDSPHFSNSQVRSFLINNNLYQPNYYGRWYSAFFTTVSKFPWPDATFTANTISNLSDGSNVAALSLSYELVPHLTLSGGVNAFFGSASGEYTYSGIVLSPELSILMAF